MTVRGAFKAASILTFVAAAVFVAVGIYRAGGAVFIPPSSQPMNLARGAAEGRRIDGRAWSLHYDHIETSADGAVANIEGIHDGIMFRKGKPYVRLRAKHVTVNTITNDLAITGPLTITTLDGQSKTFTTDAATWTNFTQKLFLPRTSTMRSGDAVLRIASVDIDFRSGKVVLGRISGGFRL